MTTRRATSSKKGKAQNRATATAEAQLRSFLAKFDPVNQRLIRSVRRNVRAKFPAAFEIVYDNYNFLVIGYSPTERPSDAIVSITANASGVGLCFLHGASLPDPDRLLIGSGVQTRFIRVPSADVLDSSGVLRLIKAARACSIPASSGGARRGKLIIQSVSAKQRPRRKAALLDAAASGL